MTPAVPPQSVKTRGQASPLYDAGGPQAFCRSFVGALAVNGGFLYASSMKRVVPCMLFVLIACGSPPKPKADTAPTAASADVPTTTAADSGAAPTASTATKPEEAPAAPEPGPELVVAPMKISIFMLTNLGPNGERTKASVEKPNGTFEIKADKTILMNGKSAGSFDKNTLTGADKSVLVSVMKDGSVQPATETKGAQQGHFSATDELVFTDSSKITVNDKGEVAFIKGDGTVRTSLAKPKVSGFKPTARRALLVLLSNGWRLAPPAQ
jgi:hypothetical protein